MDTKLKEIRVKITLDTKLKEIRVRIFTLIKLLFLLGQSREISLCKTHLERSRMFLGKVFGEMYPDSDPYPESRDPKSDKVEPTADAPDNAVALPYETPIANVKELRSRLDEITNELKELYRNPGVTFTDFWGSEYYMVVVLSLVEACMWLDVELQRYAGDTGQNQEGPSLGFIRDIGELSAAQLDA